MGVVPSAARVMSISAQRKQHTPLALPLERSLYCVIDLGADFAANQVHTYSGAVVGAYDSAWRFLVVMRTHMMATQGEREREMERVVQKYLPPSPPLPGPWSGQTTNTRGVCRLMTT